MNSFDPFHAIRPEISFFHFFKKNLAWNFLFFYATIDHLRPIIFNVLDRLILILNPFSIFWDFFILLFLASLIKKVVFYKRSSEIWHVMTCLFFADESFELIVWASVILFYNI